MSTVIYGDKKWRTYRKIELDNGLPVHLIRDTKADVGVAAFVVKSGGCDDPEDTSGLAHLCEHMLFVSNDQNPEKYGFSKLISDVGGTNNAYTTHFGTAYYFETPDTEFLKAFKAFSAFFNHHRFLASDVEKEVTAVHSEHETHMSGDNSKLWEVIVDNTDSQDLYKNFITGSKETLNQSPQELVTMLETCYKAHYRPDNAFLIVLGSGDFVELEQMCRSQFESLKKPSSPLIHIDPTTMLPRFTFREEDAPVPIIKTKLSSEHTQSMCIFFNTLCTDLMVDTVLGILCDNYPGSLHDKLVEVGAILSVSYDCLVYNTFKTATVALSLTPVGMSNWQDVVAAVLTQLKRICLDNSKTFYGLYKEYRYTEELNSVLSSGWSPLSFVTNQIPPFIHETSDFKDRFNSNGTRKTKYKPFSQVYKLLHRIAADVSSSHMVMLCYNESAELHLGKETPHLHMPFSREDVCLNYSEHTKYAVETNLPSKNPYITPYVMGDDKQWQKVLDSFANDEITGIPTYNLSSHIKTFPETSMGTVYYVEKILFDSCGNIDILLQNGQNDSIRMTVLLKLFITCVFMSIDRENYYSEKVGLVWGARMTRTGIRFKFSGPRPFLATFALNVVEKFLSPPENFMDHFDAAKETTLGNLEYNYERPYVAAHTLMAYFFVTNTTPYNEQQKELKLVTKDNLLQYSRFLFCRGVARDALFTGYKREQIETFMTKLDESLFKDRYVSVLARPLRSVVFPKGITNLWKSTRETDEESAIAVYYSFGSTNFRTHTMLSLLSKLVSPHFYTFMRFEGQTGYIAYCYSEILEMQHTLCFMVQTSKDLDLVYRRILTFVSDEMQTILSKISTEKYEQCCESIVHNLENPMRTHNELSMNVGGLVTSNVYGSALLGNRMHQLLQQKEIPLSEVSQLYKNHMVNHENRRICVSRVCPVRPEGSLLESDYAEFQKYQVLAPQLMSQS